MLCCTPLGSLFLTLAPLSSGARNHQPTGNKLQHTATQLLHPPDFPSSTLPLLPPLGTKPKPSAGDSMQGLTFTSLRATQTGITIGLSTNTVRVRPFFQSPRPSLCAPSRSHGWSSGTARTLEINPSHLARAPIARP